MTKKYQGIVKRVVLVNIGVEAENPTEARSKLLDRAEALPPDIFDYVLETNVYMRDWDEQGRGRLVAILGRKDYD